MSPIKPPDMSYEFSFEKLIVWQKAKDLAVQLYRETQDFPKAEQFGLTSQIRRAGVSIPSDLAEGSARQTAKDKAHFSTMAFGSLSEITNHIIIAKELELLKEENYIRLRQEIAEVSRLLTAYRNSQLR